MHHEIFLSDTQRVDYSIKCKMINIYCTNNKGSDYITKSYKSNNKDISQQNNVEINLNLTNSMNTSNKTKPTLMKYDPNSVIEDENLKKYVQHKKQKFDSSDILSNKRSSMLHTCSICSRETIKGNTTMDEINWPEYVNTLERIRLPNSKCDIQTRIKNQNNNYNSRSKLNNNNNNNNNIDLTKANQRTKKCNYNHDKNKYFNEKKRPTNLLNQNGSVKNQVTLTADTWKEQKLIYKPNNICITKDIVFDRLIRRLEEKVDSIIQTSIHVTMIIHYLLINLIICTMNNIKRNSSKTKLILQMFYFYNITNLKKYFKNLEIGNKVERTFIRVSDFFKMARFKAILSMSGWNEKNNSENFIKNVDSLILILTELKEIKEILKLHKKHSENNEDAIGKMASKIELSTATSITKLPSFSSKIPPPPPPLPPSITESSKLSENKINNRANYSTTTTFPRPTITVADLKSVRLKKIS